MAADYTFNNNPAFRGMAQMTRLQFECEGTPQDIFLISPNTREEKHPLVVFLQGSGWTNPNRFYQLPQLCAYAQKGLAVALISHRDATKGHPFPAYLKDAKAAIRFLRQQAEELWLDSDRVAFFGTSSGGNTALLVGLTGDDPRYRTGDYLGQSDAVKAVVDCFGPTDLVEYEGSPLTEQLKAMLANNKEQIMQLLKAQAQQEGQEMLGIMLALFGEQNPLKVLEAMSPLREARAGRDYPPILMLHGDNDNMVPLSQSLRMQERLNQVGAQNALAVIRGAEHEGSFWSQEVHDLILNFLKKHL